MTAYYNEHDPKAAAWLRELIQQGHIAPGEVDERSIEDVVPSDLTGFRQCHFFAGIGGWSYALRLAGWPDDRPVWTGSCPCQPFSAAGKQQGVSDARHLWPHWFRLINECRPDVVFGEQVAAAVRHGWLDLVSDNLEAAGYAIGSFVLGAHSVGAPHIRQRLWFIATLDYTADARRQVTREHVSGSSSLAARSEQSSGVGIVADPISSRLEGHSWHERDGDESGRLGAITDGSVAESGESGGMADTAGSRWIARIGHDDSRRGELDIEGGIEVMRPSPVNGLWRDADWLFCRDGKWRPVEPGSQPLAHGVSARLGRLRGYGNAIVPQVAAEVIGAFMDSEETRRTA